ncbi:MAG: endopeptidase La [Candidatus Cloacimonadota bacterium]|nr:MAG: endopeptidase La [Candidatus Cloacimonadota bacterium]
MESNNRIPRSLAVLTVNNLVMYPNLIIPLIVSEEDMIKVIDYALANDRFLGFFLSRENIDTEVEDLPVYKYGTAVTILKMFRNPDGSISLLLQGISRIKIDKVLQKEPFIKVEVNPLPEETGNEKMLAAYKMVAIGFFKTVLGKNNERVLDLIKALEEMDDFSRVADIIAGNSPVSVEEKQSLLETVNLKERYELLNKFLSDLSQRISLENEIRDRIQNEMEEEQRRYYLTEQLHAIKEELGEDDDGLGMEEVKRWEEKFKKANLPEQAAEVAQEELKRLISMNPASSDYALILNYLDWLVKIPWSISSEDVLDLKKIDRILTKDHFGLEKPKERIMEFIAVKKLRKKLKGPILCFAGPPGVGKTSLGKSIARSMGRKFIRFALGGINDESEIRGHRRTYVGAMPGKIINEIKRCGTKNPVFMLDEIDKVCKDFRGDPSSALLEVLDPEQNHSFTDNYLNLPFDLSEIMFITTANSLHTIPPPLRDRMEIIEFSSYTESEKINIARKYLVPKEAENNGITGKNIVIKKSALEEIVRFYVREAGVRNLQRQIGTIMRKVARKAAEGSDEKYIITSKNVKDYLGSRKFSHDMAKQKPEIAVVTGLAWTAAGGEIMFCEASEMPGKGNLILTGSLGEVMKESARIAMSYLKSNYKKYKLDLKDFTEKDIHIHFPAGAVPKDGPSAGITLTVCLASLLSKRKVYNDRALTGEVTLQGKILPVGGVKEKILGAKRAGIFKVILPEENKDSYDDLEDYIKEDMKVNFVETAEEAIELMLEKSGD